MTSDPIGLDGGLNTYGYVGNATYQSIDPYGLFSISKDGETTFFTNFHLLPSFTIPTPLGWKDYKYGTGLTWYHEYNMGVKVNGLTVREKNSLQEFIINNPTPNSNAKPASYQGTHNPASPNFGAFANRYRTRIAKWFTRDDDVISYTRKGINGLNYVINVTKNNHSLRYGIVIRGLECKGNYLIMHNYGEGNGYLQRLPFADANINNIWYWASEYALESVTNKKWRIKGEDWTENGD